LALSTLVSGAIFVLVLGFALVAGIPQKLIGPFLGVLAIFGSLASVSGWLSLRLVRNVRSANGITIMPSWIISAVGVLLLGGAIIVSIEYPWLAPESFMAACTMVFASRLIRQKTLGKGPGVAAIVGRMSDAETDPIDAACASEAIHPAGPWDSEVRYILREEDLAALQRHRTGSWPGSPNLLRMLMITCTAATVSTGLLLLIGWVCGNQLGPIANAIAVAASILLGLLIGFSGHRHSIVPGKSAAAPLSERQQLSISPEQLALKTSAFSTQTQWRLVHDIVVGSDHAFFYVTSPTAFVLPKRAFIDRQAFADFVERARGYRAAARESHDPGRRSP